MASKTAIFPKHPAATGAVKRVAVARSRQTAARTKDEWVRLVIIFVTFFTAGCSLPAVTDVVVVVSLLKSTFPIMPTGSSTHTPWAAGRQAGARPIRTPRRYKRCSAFYSRHNV